MDILFVSHSSELGGAERSLLSVVREANSRGHQVRVSIPSAGSGVLEKQIRAIRGVSTERRRWVLWMSGRLPILSGPARVLVALRDTATFSSALDDRRPDVVVVNSTLIPHAGLAAMRSGVPVITMVRETIFSNPTLRSFTPKRVIASLISRSSTRIIAVSHYVATQFGRDSVVVYPDVSKSDDRARQPPVRSDSEQLRAVMLGSISAEKGQLEAVAAAAAARRLGANVSLEIYGPGPDKEIRRLRETIARFSATSFIRYAGIADDVSDVLAISDVSLVCSHNEAFGRVTAESIIAGVPVIGYALGGTREILEQGGGILTRPNPSDMGAAIADYATNADTRRQLIQECRDRAEAGGVGGNAADVVDIIESCLPG